MDRCLDPTPNPKGYFGVHNEENLENKVVQLEADTLSWRQFWQ